MSVPTLDQAWECPKCGQQIAMGSPAVMHPPTCTWGHPPTECEQVAMARFGLPRDQRGFE